jgi:hypothetical protein
MNNFKCCKDTGEKIATVKIDLNNCEFGIKKIFAFSY